MRRHPAKNRLESSVARLRPAKAILLPNPGRQQKLTTEIVSTACRRWGGLGVSVDAAPPPMDDADSNANKVWSVRRIGS